MALTDKLAAIGSAIREKTGKTDLLTLDQMPSEITSIQGGGQGGSSPLDPVQVYNDTRPSDWLTMPTPNGNEMYLLFHIPEGTSSLIAFTVTCTGDYTVALGTVRNGAFVENSRTSLSSGTKFEAELFADNYGDITSDGMKQVMLKVSGTDIRTWTPSSHSKRSYKAWNIVEISCNLPFGTGVTCGSSSSSNALKKLRYFEWYGENNVTNMNSMFQNCYSLTSIPALDTSRVTNMSSMFNGCYSLTAIPSLDTSRVTDMSSMFRICDSLTAIPSLDTSRVTNMSSMFRICFSLTKLLLLPTVSGWAGYDISLKDCSLSHLSIVEFFNSLPIITTSKGITLTGNPGVSELTDAEKAIATEKGWTLTI